MNDFDAEHIDKISQIAFNNQQVDSFIPNWSDVEIQLNRISKVKKSSILIWFLLPTFFSFISLKLTDTRNIIRINQTKTASIILANKKYKNAKVVYPKIIDLPSDNKEASSKILVRQSIRNTLRTDNILRSNKKEQLLKKSSKKQTNSITLTKTVEGINHNIDYINIRAPQHLNDSGAGKESSHISEASNDISHAVDNASKAPNDSNLAMSEIIGKVEINDTLKQLVKASEQGISKQSKISFIISYGKDYNFPNINAINYLASSIGLGISYRLSKNISLRSGINYVHSPVYQNGDDFSFKSPSNIPSYTTIKLIDALGYVNLIEIPLAMRYNATPSKKINWITSLGMSSHIFLSQEYTYRLLLNNATQITAQSNEDPDDNNQPHILNNLVVSTGIGLKLNKSLYLEIDPTFKLPLEELNEAHKTLGSLGIYFNLRYSFKAK